MGRTRYATYDTASQRRKWGSRLRPDEPSYDARCKNISDKGAGHIDHSRKAAREGNEVTLQHVSPKESILIDELDEQRLAQLQTFIVQLQKPPERTIDFTCRIKAFGACPQIEHETPREFYARL